MPVNCPCCNEPIINQSDTLKCDGCKARIHIACVGLSADDATRITRSKAKSSAVKTYCTPCSVSVDKFSKLSDLIASLQTNLESKINELVNKIEQLERHGGGLAMKPDLYEAVVNETMDRISRANNIVIFNVPEADDPHQQKQHDEAIVKEITDTLQVSDTTTPVSVCRFGKAGNSRPRILKVTLSNQDEARKILRQ